MEGIQDGHRKGEHSNLLVSVFTLQYVKVMFEGVCSRDQKFALQL